MMSLFSFFCFSPIDWTIMGIMMAFRVSLFIGLILIIGAACTTTSSKNRGSLSDAMDKARDDYEEERSVPDEDKPFWPEEDEEDYPHKRYGETEEPEAGEPYADISFDEDLSLSLRLGQSWADGPYFLSRGQIEFLAGFQEGEVSLHGFLGLTLFDTRKSHALYESIKDESVLAYAGMEMRYYPWPDWLVFSPYALGRLGGFYYSWEFRNPLMAGDDVIRGDTVGGILAALGLGIDLIRWGPLRLGGQVIPEIYLFGPETAEGFTNDYFSAQGSLKWSLEGGLTF